MCVQQSLLDIFTNILGNKEQFTKTRLVVCGLYYNCFTIIIYDRNDSGQNYKTTITIVIDDPSLS